jgi:hypothetical protein
LAMVQPSTQLSAFFTDIGVSHAITIAIRPA